MEGEEDVDNKNRKGATKEGSKEQSEFGANGKKRREGGRKEGREGVDWFNNNKNPCLWRQGSGQQ